ncbi:hypothetical protein A3C17_02005 [Candidatus Uhrbacteria bacterium RIFCSPHIGHO2_02_FULL_53_13]|uniref:Uncharacterized protein n=1 Tax=Candidatus Uhrbacteria bacterium RIFCSPHIGHO2_02_FULL_53_13 TaxID=1802389 RepID=A0A1F7U0Q6_9BACT|nr:MAG: hypothetical protein A3C17_02005 [Candidatus Uhrbacteria bacterium RIFCSPHIGHO2_02_FULL_53_13]
MDLKGNADVGQGANGSPQNPHTTALGRPPVRIHSIVWADCARAVITLAGTETALASVATNIPFWGQFDMESRFAECERKLNLGPNPRKHGKFALRVGVNCLVSHEAREVMCAFVVDTECVGDVEYIAQHPISSIVAPLRYAGDAVVLGAIVGRSLVLVTRRSIISTSDSTVLAGLIRRHGEVLEDSQNTVVAAPRGEPMLDITDNKLVVRIGHQLIEISSALPGSGARLTTSQHNLKPVMGPSPAPVLA